MIYGIWAERIGDAFDKVWSHYNLAKEIELTPTVHNGRYGTTVLNNAHRYLAYLAEVEKDIYTHTIKVKEE